MNAQAATPQRAPRITNASPSSEAEVLRQGKQDLGNAEGRVRPDQDSADQGRRAGRDDDRKKGPVGNLGQQDFEGEQHAAERRVERRGDAGAGAGGEQRHLLPASRAGSACEKADPSAAPIWMIGPSRPTAAPLPIDSAEASDLMTATCQRMLPPP